jgi:hypothetical protein
LRDIYSEYGAPCAPYVFQECWSTNLSFELFKKRSENACYLYKVNNAASPRHRQWGTKEKRLPPGYAAVITNKENKRIE